MPTKHKILDGPPFKYFFFHGHAVSGGGQIVNFKLSDWTQGDDRTSYYILMVGKPIVIREEEGLSDDEYLFVAKSHGGSVRMNRPACYLVGDYNSRTRKGACRMFERAEIVQCPFARELFGFL